MSEVDRLSNSGLYPALPIADKRPSRDGGSARARGGKQPPEKSREKPPAPAGDSDSADPTSPRPPKSVIDEYA
jgi:hypothetical protein